MYDNTKFNGNTLHLKTQNLVKNSFINLTKTLTLYVTPLTAHFKRCDQLALVILRFQSNPSK